MDGVKEGKWDGVGKDIEVGGVEGVKGRWRDEEIVGKVGKLGIRGEGVRVWGRGKWGKVWRRRR